MQMVRRRNQAECSNFGNVARLGLASLIWPRMEKGSGWTCFPKSPPAALTELAEPTFRTPRSYTERRKTGAKRLIWRKKNIRAGEAPLILKKSKPIDDRQADEYAGDLLWDKGGDRYACPTISPAKSPSFCCTGSRATKKPSGL